MQASDDGIVDAGFSFYDAKTFLHRNHVSKGTRKSGDAFFSQQQLDEIKATVAAFRDWP